MPPIEAITSQRSPHRCRAAGSLLALLAAFPAVGGAAAAPAAQDLPLAAQFAVSAALGRDSATYHVVAAGDSAFAAANPEQGYAAEFTAQGFTVSAGDLHWGLRLEGWGCGGRVEAVEPALPQARGNRVELRRGPVLEWYENGPFGLQQGFTLERAPRGCASGEAVSAWCWRRSAI